MPILKRNGKTFSGTPTKVDTAKSYTTFDSADDKNPTTWSDVELLTSKEEQRSLFSKISTMFKNIRYLYKILGTTDISNIGDGTVTGGIDALNSKLGNTDISAIGDGTVTGGLDALNNNLEKQIIITQSITIENSINPYKIIVNKFSKQPPTGYALLEAFHPASGMITRFYLNYSGDLYATDVGVTKTGEWWINGAYIAK